MNVMSEVQWLLEEYGPSTGAAAIVAAALVMICGWPWRAPQPTLATIGWVLGVSVGFVLGRWFLSLGPLWQAIRAGAWQAVTMDALVQSMQCTWPPTEAMGRFLLWILPVIVLIELIVATVSTLPRWGVWLLRLPLAFAVARVLLHGSVYLSTSVSGPGSSAWTPAQSWLILAGLGAGLAGVWFALDALATRSPGRTVPLALAMSAAATGLTMMLSGYATGGPVAFPLAGALIGAALGSLLLRAPPDPRCAIGVGVVCLFSLLIIGHFFSVLTAPHAALLFAAPLLCWLPESPHLRNAPRWLTRPAQVVLVMIPLALVLFEARAQFILDSHPAPIESGSGEIPEATIEDYRNFGK
jgi:hypothetical protein